MPSWMWSLASNPREMRVSKLWSFTIGGTVDGYAVGVPGETLDEAIDNFVNKHEGDLMDSGNYDWDSEDVRDAEWEEE